MLGSTKNHGVFDSHDFSWMVWRKEKKMVIGKNEKIRDAVLSDFERIDEIYTEGSIFEVLLQFPKKKKKELLKEFSEFRRARLGGFSNGIKSKLQKWVVAVDGDLVVGFGQAVRNRNSKSSEIEKIYVDSRFKRKGLGSRILKELISWLKLNNAEIVRDNIFYKNKSSIKFHEKMGFDIVAVKMDKRLK